MKKQIPFFIMNTENPWNFEENFYNIKNKEITQSYTELNPLCLSVVLRISSV